MLTLLTVSLGFAIPTILAAPRMPPLTAHPQATHLGAKGSIKSNEEGVIEWSQTYGGPYGDGGRCGAQTADGGYLLIGSTESYGTARETVTIIITLPYSGQEVDGGKWGAQTADGGYLRTGTTESYGVEEPDVWLIKVSGAGAVTSPAVTETETITTSSVVSEVLWGSAFLVLVVLGIVFVCGVDFVKRKRKR